MSHPSLSRRAVMATAGLAATGLWLAASRPAAAASQAPYTAMAFNDAKTAGKPILVAVHASWCPICAKQRPILESLASDPAFKDLVMLTVDFDAQKDVVESFGVRMQSTLIAFRGAAERDRSVGVTDPAAIRALLAKAVA